MSPVVVFADATEADRLAAEHLWRCEAVARRFTRRRPWDYEEAYSAALGGLAEAIRTHIAGQAPGGFLLHVKVTIVRRVMNALHAVRRPKGFRTRMGMPRHAAPATQPLVDVGDDRDAPGWAMEWEDAVLALSRQLPSRHGEMLRARYLHADAADARGAARRMGMSVAAANVIHSQLRAMLREKAGRVEHMRSA